MSGRLKIITKYERSRTRGTSRLFIRQTAASHTRIVERVEQHARLVARVLGQAFRDEFVGLARYDRGHVRNVRAGLVRRISVGHRFAAGLVRHVTSVSSTASFGCFFCRFLIPATIKYASFSINIFCSQEERE